MVDIVITEEMERDAVATLEPEFSIHWDPELWRRPDALRARLGDARGLIVRNRTQVDEALLAAAPRLQVIGRLGVGLDNIDMPACAAAGVSVCPATGANAVAVAEYVIASALILLRGVYGATPQILAGTWPRGAFGRGREAAGKCLGLIGFGDIGQAVARRGAALGMSVLAHDPLLPADDPAWAGVERASLNAVLELSDVISLHVPLTEETRGLIGADALAAMRKGAILINSARGGIVDEAALAEALRRGHLGGAALDVFDPEPPDPAAITRFSGLDNVILTPHIAGHSLEAHARVSTVTVEAVRRVLRERAA